MALVKISQLPATTTPSIAQEIPTNNAGVNEKITISQLLYSQAHSIAADYNGSLTDGYTHIYFNHSASTKLIQYNLPNCASSNGRKIICQNLATGLSYVNGNGANIILGNNTLTTAPLIMMGDKLVLRSNGTAWFAEDWFISMDTKWFNRNDETNVHIGNGCGYDNKSAAVDLTGQKFTLDSGVTGLIIYDSGGTGLSGTLYVCNWIGVGYGVNNEEGTCGSGGYTFDVDEGGGSSKNVNYNLCHGFGVSNIFIEKYFWTSSDATEVNILQLNFEIGYTPAGATGNTIHGIDTNFIKNQIGGNGLHYVADNGVNNTIASSDWYFRYLLCIQN